MSNLVNRKTILVGLKVLDTICHRRVIEAVVEELELAMNNLGQDSPESVSDQIQYLKDIIPDIHGNCICCDKPVELEEDWYTTKLGIVHSACRCFS
jgi:hypothetical protein